MSQLLIKSFHRKRLPYKSPLEPSRGCHLPVLAAPTSAKWLRKALIRTIHIFARWYHERQIHLNQFFTVSVIYRSSTATESRFKWVFQVNASQSAHGGCFNPSLATHFALRSYTDLGQHPHFFLPPTMPSAEFEEKVCVNDFRLFLKGNSFWFHGFCPLWFHQLRGNLPNKWAAIGHEGTKPK